ncbi:DUF2577 family protein [Desulfosporosinus lacus]|uniref:Uncharacterized protein n=1 Tax=Desulfosporosinus lacus DSM 15449 TaxID=1121420 RepID=A0A1M5QMN4_9FIRM|nr:DUF2577 family protein [Desulfosporosinus lacus]SHH14980.1 Protein of unknown function [Desulfosporosinus lacus DSM 15449]
MKNPYSAIINHMRTQGAKFNTPYVQVGVVVSPDPLTIKLRDLQIGKDNLLVADHLLQGTDWLMADNLVALIPTLDEQTYIVLARVVSV